MNPYVPASEGRSMQRVYSSPEALRRQIPSFEHYFEDRSLGEEDKRTWRTYAEWLGLLAEKTPGRGLLDVGCGGGQFLEAAAGQGWKAEGVEFEGENLERLKARGLRVKGGDFLEADPGGRPFDVITMWDVFEHFEEPKQALGRCRDLLKPGGLLLIAVPRENSLLSWTVRLLYRLSFGLLKTPLKMVYLLDHPVFYSTRTLTDLLERNGFAVERVGMDETDLRRVTFGPVVATGLRFLFRLARPFGLQNRMIVLARKNISARKGEERNHG
jgi:SAM-dependent methyltransferase